MRAGAVKKQTPESNSETRDFRFKSRLTQRPIWICGEFYCIARVCAVAFITLTVMMDAGAFAGFPLEQTVLQQRLTGDFRKGVAS
jgi:hypothetical protein